MSMNGDPSGVTLLVQLLIIVVLTILNAFFAAAEIAIVSVSKATVEEKAEDGSKKDKRILKAIEEPNQFLSTIQVAITFAGFLSSAIAATSLSGSLDRLMGDFPGSQEVSIVIITVILSYISLVFGELLPKRIAMNKPYGVARFTEPYVRFFRFIFSPFVKLLTGSLNLVFKLIPMNFSKKEDTASRSEVLATIRESKDSGTINSDEYQMMQGIIEFSDKNVREIMVPRTDAFMVDINDPKDQTIDAILEQPFSRVPVYGGEKDKVIGIIHIKDILKQARKSGFESISLDHVMVEPMFVPETTSIDALLLKMKSTQTQMAVVMDEYGGVVGLATIEDIIEEIVGDIDDEYDQAITAYRRINSNEYSIIGKMTTEDFNELFEEDLHLDDYDSVAGVLIAQAGDIPTENVPISITLDDGTKLTSGKVNGSRIEDVIVTIPDDKLKQVMKNMYEKKY
ncbi:hemolysin family protein [Lactobacillus terrae]|uniref:hemolysin family protein n=1 Tax=Lactobacillus terrae TaxID=2269374 RepID=UPI001FE53760|nr:hemolysin family protein [Lactobacillus terrae]